MKHHVSLALLLTLPAALTLALLPPIANEPHYLFHRQDDRTVSVQQSYAPLESGLKAALGYLAWRCHGCRPWEPAEEADACVNNGGEPDLGDAGPGRHHRRG